MSFNSKLDRETYKHSKDSKNESNVNSLKNTSRSERNLIRQLSLNIKNLSLKRAAAQQNQASSASKPATNEDRRAQFLGIAPSQHRANVHEASREPQMGAEQTDVVFKLGSKAFKLKNKSPKASNKTFERSAQESEFLIKKADLIVKKNEVIPPLLHFLNYNIYSMRTPWRYLSKEKTLRNNIDEIVTFFKLFQRLSAEYFKHVDLSPGSHNNYELETLVNFYNSVYSKINFLFRPASYEDIVRSILQDENLRVPRAKVDFNYVIACKDVICINNKYYHVANFGLDSRSLAYQKYMVFDLCDEKYSLNDLFRKEFNDQIVELKMNEQFIPSFGYLLMVCSSVLFWIRFDALDKFCVLNYTNINFNILLVFSCLILAIDENIANINDVQDRLLNTLRWRQFCQSSADESNASVPIMFPITAWPPSYKRYLYYFYNMLKCLRASELQDTPDLAQQLESEQFNYVNTGFSPRAVELKSYRLESVVLVNSLIPRHKIDIEIYQLNSNSARNYVKLPSKSASAASSVAGANSDALSHDASSSPRGSRPLNAADQDRHSVSGKCKSYDSIMFRNCRCSYFNQVNCEDPVKLISCPYNYTTETVINSEYDDNVIYYFNGHSHSQQAGDSGQADNARGHDSQTDPDHSQNIILTGDVTIVFVVDIKHLGRNYVASYSFNTSFLEHNLVELKKEDLDIWDQKCPILPNSKILIRLSPLERCEAQALLLTSSIASDTVVGATTHEGWYVYNKHGSVMNFIANHIKRVDGDELQQLLKLTKHSIETCVLALKLCDTFSDALNLLIQLKLPQHSNYYHNDVANEFYRLNIDAELDTSRKFSHLMYESDVPVSDSDLAEPSKLAAVPEDTPKPAESSEVEQLPSPDIAKQDVEKPAEEPVEQDIAKQPPEEAPVKLVIEEVSPKPAEEDATTLVKEDVVKPMDLDDSKHVEKEPEPVVEKPVLVEESKPAEPVEDKTHVEQVDVVKPVEEEAAKPLVVEEPKKEVEQIPIEPTPIGRVKSPDRTPVLSPTRDDVAASDAGRLEMASGASADAVGGLGPKEADEADRVDASLVTIDKELLFKLSENNKLLLSEKIKYLLMNKDFILKEYKDEGLPLSNERLPLYNRRSVTQETEQLSDDQASKILNDLNEDDLDKLVKYVSDNRSVSASGESLKTDENFEVKRKELLSKLNDENLVRLLSYKSDSLSFGEFVDRDKLKQPEGQSPKPSAVHSPSTASVKQIKTEELTLDLELVKPPSPIHASVDATPSKMLSMEAEQTPSKGPDSKSSASAEDVALSPGKSELGETPMAKELLLTTRLDISLSPINKVVPVKAPPILEPPAKMTNMPPLPLKAKVVEPVPSPKPAAKQPVSKEAPSGKMPKKMGKKLPPVPKGPVKSVKRALPLGVKLHWKPLLPSKLTNTIFTTFNDNLLIKRNSTDNDLIDIGNIKKLFTRSSQSTNSISSLNSRSTVEMTDNQNEAKRKKTSKLIEILDNKRAQNILIILRFNSMEEYLKLLDGVDSLEILNSILSHFSAVNSGMAGSARMSSRSVGGCMSVRDKFIDDVKDNISKLFLSYPNEFEIEMLVNSYNAIDVGAPDGSPANASTSSAGNASEQLSAFGGGSEDAVEREKKLKKYRDIERMLLELLLRDRMWGKINLVKYYIDMEQQLMAINRQLHVYNSAVSEVKNSKLLPLILNIILQYGNFVNYGNINEGEKGFTLSSTIKLIDFKSSDNTLSSLHYLIINLYIKLLTSCGSESGSSAPIATGSLNGQKSSAANDAPASTPVPVGSSDLGPVSAVDPTNIAANTAIGTDRSKTSLSSLESEPPSSRTTSLPAQSSSNHTTGVPASSVESEPEHALGQSLLHIDKQLKNVLIAQKISSKGINDTLQELSNQLLSIVSIFDRPGATSMPNTIPSALSNLSMCSDAESVHSSAMSEHSSSSAPNASSASADKRINSLINISKKKLNEVNGHKDKTFVELKNVWYYLGEDLIASNPDKSESGAENELEKIFKILGELIMCIKKVFVDVKAKPTKYLLVLSKPEHQQLFLSSFMDPKSLKNYYKGLNKPN